MANGKMTAFLASETVTENDLVVAMRSITSEFTLTKPSVQPYLCFMVIYKEFDVYWTVHHCDN